MQEQKCLELRIHGDSMDLSMFERLAESQHTVGISEETDFDSGVIQYIAWFADKESTKQRAQLTAAALLSGASAEQFSLHELGGDWETAWQKNWFSMPIGKNLCVRPSFCEPLAGNYVDIVLDPGMAFGTGQHETTQLCLEAIENICSEHVPEKVLDMGAGSGLLAIAATKFGSKNVLAIDNDPIAVEACDVNASINHVTIDSKLGDTPPEQLFDLVVANILAQPLIDMAKELRNCTGNSLILSGLLQTQIDDVASAYQHTGLKLIETTTKGEWAALTLKVPH
ncbi:MAG: 50S ribosomal protein L11 methyltransferase [Mariprofundaceae bacterium]